MIELGSPRRTPAGRTLAVLIALTGAAGLARAETDVLIARSDPDLPNRFTIEFPPELGGPQTADIVSTDFILKIDEGTHFARIQSYYQLVNPLDLGGVSTGDIIVRLGGKSNGTYEVNESNEGIFITEQPYDIFFEGDLRQFGLESPFTTDSSAQGRVLFDEERAGRIALAWDGEGEIPNPRDPEHPFQFHYQCEVNSNFSRAVPCDSVRRVKTSGCLKGKMRVVVVMNDESRDGQVVAIEVDGEPFALHIRGRKARRVLKGRSGPEVVSLITARDRCKRDQVVDCGK